MENYVLRGLGLFILLTYASSRATTMENDFFREYLSGLSKNTEIALVIDLTTGNVEKIQDAVGLFTASYAGYVTFGVINGSGYETTTTLDSLQIGPLIQEWQTMLNPNASSNDLLRYLLKTVSLMATESRVLLFTGRTIEEGPLYKACLDQLQEKRTRLDVILTGESHNVTYLLQMLAESSNGSLTMINKVLESNSKQSSQELVKEGSVKPSKMILKSNLENFDEISSEIKDDYERLKKLENLRFPETEPEANNSIEPLVLNAINRNLSLERQRAKSSILIPIRVEVSSRSNLESIPGTHQQIQYDVKNNLHTPIRLHFTASQPRNLVIIKVTPEWYNLAPLDTIKVDVTYQSSAAIPEGGEGLLPFTASMDSGGITLLPTIIYFTSTPKRDTWDPIITYSYIGDCRGHDKPDNCDTGEWKLEATFQDETSGLKKVLSEPYGLIFKSPFTAGTKLPVSVFYTASCCQPKIDIWAEDGQGNYVKRSCDVNNQGLLAGEIAALVLGILLLICLIIGIIATIVIIRKRKQHKLIIPRYQSST